ncbi:hypothetical protein DCAR_0414846 [Daucus carota subsp. sativus]|uniref:E3 ubiquitin protein ligase n=1 Tax=Daucus carota subsp. sativus TaxID=79200 RepID=A0AAF0WW24_DAUCS|nr:hypothetical protein DCAR_0414846 [Daucus carota subsp. sativus]
MEYQVFSSLNSLYFILNFLDTKVLQFQNLKLVQKLEAQKVECTALENKYSQLRDKQLPYDNTLEVVHKAWEELERGIDLCNSRTYKLFSGNSISRYDCSSPREDEFLKRLVETGATESSFLSNIHSQVNEVRQAVGERTKMILSNLVGGINDLWCLKGGLYASAQNPEDGYCRQNTSIKMEEEVKTLRLLVSDLHLKHRTLSSELQNQRDIDAKNKAQLKHLKAELDSTIAELDESNCRLATLKAEKNAVKGVNFPVLVGNKHVASERARNKQEDLHDMESTLKDLLDQSSSRLIELKRLYEERIGLLKQLADLQNTLKSVKFVSSSRAYLLVKDQLAKAKASVLQYQVLYEKLQVEKDNLAWREKESIMESDVVDVFHQSTIVNEYRIEELEKEIEKQVSSRLLIETKLEEASREPGRKEIIAEFKALVSSFPDNMRSMQEQLTKYKEVASDVHSLRAEVQSLSDVFNRKAKEVETLSVRSSDQVAEIKKLQAVVEDLKESDLDLKLILEMYRCESIDSRDISEARTAENKAWAQVQSLNSALDEQNLESRVKKAVEAEATTQQKLAAAEAEIADLRQNFENSRREKVKLSDVLKSKQEENEVYLSEIETIGQAYDDVQTQNQHLLQQITERDDYNMKLVIEGARARQLRDTILMEKQTMYRTFQQASSLVDFFETKTSRIEDQARMCSDQVQRLAEDRVQKSVSLENTQRRLSDANKSSQLEEEVEVARRKVLRLRSEIEGSPVVQRLQQELKEYKDILKCSICLERPKEVVITKCYHLFCGPCVQKIAEGRHRKCPVCAASFGANDVKPVYI